MRLFLNRMASATQAHEVVPISSLAPCLGESFDVVNVNRRFGVILPLMDAMWILAQWIS